MESSPRSATTLSPTNVSTIAQGTLSVDTTSATTSPSSTVGKFPVDIGQGQVTLEVITSQSTAVAHETDSTITELPTTKSSTIENEPSTSAWTSLTPSTSSTSSSKNTRCLKCRHCTYRTEQSGLLLAHLRWHTKQRQKECETNYSDDESDSSPTRSSSTVPIKLRPTARSKSWHKCTQCTFATPRIRLLDRHMKTHKRARMYMCTHCTDEFDRVGARRRHEREEHGVKREIDRTVQRTCTICPYTTWSSNRLKIHISTHANDHRYKCLKCDFSTKWKRSLAAHVEEEHTVTIDILNSSRTKSAVKRYTRYKCAKCPFTAKWKYEVNKHMKTAHPEGFEKCDKCDYSTAFAQMMTRHKTMHHDDGLHTCVMSKCTFSTRFKKTLALHVEEEHAHETTTFKCAECIFTTTVRSILLRHERLHTMTPAEPTTTNRRNIPRRVTSSLTNVGVDVQRRYRCSECRFVANQKTTLAWHFKNLHMKEPTVQNTPIGNGNMHQCPQCAFRSPTGLKLAGHIERVHGGVRPKPPPTLTKLPFTIVDPKLEPVVDGIEVKKEPMEDSELSMAADASLKTTATKTSTRTVINKKGFT